MANEIKTNHKGHKDFSQRPQNDSKKLNHRGFVEHKDVICIVCWAYRNYKRGLFTFYTTGLLTAFLTFVTMHYKTKILFLFLFLLPGIAFCIDKKKKLIVPGRWREVVRMLPDSSTQPFNDTLFIAFQPKDSFSYHYRNGFIYEGIYLVSEDSILDMGTARYKVVSRKPELMVLANQKGIFHFEVDRSDTGKVIVIRKEDSARPVTSIEVMIGRWTVYKRKADGPIDQSDNIRSIYVTGPSTDGKQGFVYSGTDPDNVPSWFIKELGGGQSLVCAGTKPRTLKVVKCQDGEMILEEEGVTYYLKQPK